MSKGSKIQGQIRRGGVARFENSQNVEMRSNGSVDVYLPLQRLVESAMLVFKNPGKLTGCENAWTDVLIKGGVLLKHPRRPLLWIQNAHRLAQLILNYLDGR